MRCSITSEPKAWRSWNPGELPPARLFYPLIRDRNHYQRKKHDRNRGNLEAEVDRAVHPDVEKPRHSSQSRCPAKRVSRSQRLPHAPNQGDNEPQSNSQRDEPAICHYVQVFIMGLFNPKPSSTHLVLRNGQEISSEANPRQGMLLD